MFKGRKVVYRGLENLVSGRKFLSGVAESFNSFFQLRDSRSSENLRFASFLRKSRARSFLTSAFLENVKMATEYSVVKPYEPTYIKSIQSQVNSPK